MTVQFWLGAAVLTVVALGFLVAPLLRDPRQAHRRRRTRSEVNAAVYRDRMDELATDLANGILGQEQYDAALADLKREMVDSGGVDPDAPAAAEHSAAGRGLVLGSALTFALLVPVASVVIYGVVGGGEEALDPQGATALAQQQQDRGHSVEEWEALLGQLQEQLERNPDNVNGWALLGRMLSQMERYGASAEAYREALERGGRTNPNLLVQYADVLAVTRGGGLDGEPMDLVKEALALDPEHVQGLWLAGSAALQKEDYAQAREYWEQLLAVLPAGSEEAGIIRDNLEFVSRLAGEG